MNNDNPNANNDDDDPTLDFFRSIESATVPNLPSAVKDAGLDEGSASLLWLALLTSYAATQPDPQQALVDDKHAAFEFSKVTDEPCEVCGTLHGVYIFGVYTKTPEELERIRNAVHREMADIQAERGDRLTS